MVLNIIQCAKLKQGRKAALLCAKLVNSDIMKYMPQTKLYTDMISYHVGTGKFRKNSYKTLLKLAPKPLRELEVVIKKTDFLATKQSAKMALAKPSKTTLGYSFSTLEDLDKIKQLVAAKPSESVESIVKAVRAKTKSEPVTAKKTKTKTAKTEKIKVKDTDDYDTEDTKSKATSRSITRDDELVFKTLHKEKSDIDIDLGECRMVKRGVIMLQTHIPPIVWKKVATTLGLQLVARQYVTAVYANVIVSPAEIDGDIQEPEAILNNANQMLALYNKTTKDPLRKLSIVGEPWKTASSTHWWYLCLPQCVVNHASFRFGSWSFAKNPTARVAHAATVA